MHITFRGYHLIYTGHLLFHDFLSAILQESGNVALANIIFHETIIPKTFLTTPEGSKKKVSGLSFLFSTLFS